MYNEELKNRFITECASSESSSKRAKMLFSYAEPFEQKYQKDLCAISEENIGEVLQKIVSARTGTQIVDMSILKRYSKWCLNNNINGACNAILGAQNFDVQKLRETMVDSPGYLDDLFDRVFPSVADGKSENLCRVYFWMAFMGIPEEDSFNIEADHVNLKKMVVQYNGNEYPIYNQSVQAFRHLCVANSFYYDFVTREAIVPRAPGDKLLRGTGNSPEPKGNSIRKAANRRISDSKVEDIKSLRYLSLKLSGALYRMYENEVRTGECDIRKGLLDYSPDVMELPPKRITRKELEFRTDYERWKAAFNK